MRMLWLASVWASALAAAQVEAAVNITVAGAIGGAPPTGVNYVNFDDLTLGSSTQTANGPAGSIEVVPTTMFDGGVVQGEIEGSYVPPILSGNQGALFGNQPDGPDTTPYLSSAADLTRLNFPSPQRYFGLLWGSVDLYNTLELYSTGSGLIGAVSGDDLFPITQGDTPTVYLNINSDVAFDYVIARSRNYAFEFDNVAYSSENVVLTGTPIIPGAGPRPTPVPDGSATIGLFGLALACLRMVARQPRAPGGFQARTSHGIRH